MGLIVSLAWTFGTAIVIILAAIVVGIWRDQRDADNEASQGFWRDQRDANPKTGYIAPIPPEQTPDIEARAAAVKAPKLTLEQWLEFDELSWQAAKMAQDEAIIRRTYETAAGAMIARCQWGFAKLGVDPIQLEADQILSDTHGDWNALKVLVAAS